MKSVNIPHQHSAKGGKGCANSVKLFLCFCRCQTGDTDVNYGQSRRHVPHTVVVVSNVQQQTRTCTLVLKPSLLASGALSPHFQQIHCMVCFWFIPINGPFYFFTFYLPYLSWNGFLAQQSPRCKLMLYQNS